VEEELFVNFRRAENGHGRRFLSRRADVDYLAVQAFDGRGNPVLVAR
jgi:hypothetical protein